MPSIREIKENPTFYSILLLGKVLPDNLFTDKLFLKLLYKNRLGKKLNLDNPVTYNEKIQWLKLYDRNPDYTIMVDKYAVKNYVKEIIGNQYIIPTIGVWDSYEEIDFEKLPNQFVLKCTHDSGGLVICSDKQVFNESKARKKITKCLKRNYYLNTREWPYKNVKPRIIAEQFMGNNDGKDLKDYKFFTFNGKCKAMFIASNRNSKEETCFDFFDRTFKHLPFQNGHPNSTIQINKPEKFEEMIELAEKLSKNIPHARIDFYEINGNIYFGEITFYHWSGLKAFNPEKWDYQFGKWLELPNK